MVMNCDQELIEKTLKRMEGAYAPNTLRAYDADMHEFLVHCIHIGASALPAEPETVAEFVDATAENSIKSSTIRRKVSSISALHRLSNQEDPTKDARVRLAVRKMHRKLGRNPSQAHGINNEVLERLLTVAGTSLRGKRDQALLLIAYDTLRRRAELVSLRIEDIDFVPGSGGSVLLRRSKTDQDGAGKYLYLSPRTCAAVQAWMQAATICDGFLLRGVNMAKKVCTSLGEGQISRIYKRLAKSAGLETRLVQSISGHSLRVGGAQDMLLAGASLPQIMVKGGWSKTDTVMRYVEKTMVLSPHLQADWKLK